MNVCTCVLCDRDENDRLKQQLAAERTKVVELEKELRGFKPFDLRAGMTGEIAKVRRDVARECAEIVNDLRKKWLTMPGEANMLNAVIDAIYAKFGVTE